MTGDRRYITEAGETAKYRGKKFIEIIDSEKSPDLDTDTPVVFNLQDSKVYVQDPGYGPPVPFSEETSLVRRGDQPVVKQNRTLDGLFVKFGLMEPPPPKDQDGKSGQSNQDPGVGLTPEDSDVGRERGCYGY